MKKTLTILILVMTLYNSRAQDCGFYPAIDLNLESGLLQEFEAYSPDPLNYEFVSASWDILGFDTILYGGNVSFQYPFAGEYEVCATATYENLATPEPDYCTTTYCFGVNVYCELDVEFITSYNDEDSTFTVVANVLNGSGDYTYYFNSWDNINPIQNGNSYTFSSISASPTVFITLYDNQGDCFSVENEIIFDNPLVECTLSLNIQVENNFLTMNGTVMNGEVQANYPGFIIDFGDGSDLGFGNEMLQSHYYGEVGTYTLCANSLAGYEDSCADTICVEVEIDSIDQTCGAAFTYTVWANGQVALNNMSGGYYTDLVWTTSEGNTSLSTNIAQGDNFVNDLPVDVTLTVSNDFTQCESSVTQTISMPDMGFTLCGNIFHDLNFNYLDDDNAPMAFTSVIIDAPNLPEPIHVIAGPDGEFCVELPLLESYSYTALVPEGSTGYFYQEVGYIMNPASGGGYEVNIIFWDSTYPTDVELYCESSGFVSAPNGGWYWFSLYNNSGFPDQGTITVTVGADETITYWDGMSGELSTDGTVFTFDYTLNPFESAWYSVGVSLEPTTPLGTIEYLSVLVESESNDIDLTNNLCLSHHLVVASYDPNNKLVLPEGEGDMGKIAPTTEWLTYTINFQNTGTAPAYTVVLEDEISQHLDLSSIEMLATSHPCTTEISGNNVTWTFSEIMLPDSFSNEPESHGFVMFRIRIHENLPDQTAIDNTAAIYFDFNEAVITNTTLNTIDYAINSTNEEEEHAAGLYPNPASDQFILNTSSVGMLRVTDVQGRCIYTSKTKVGNNEIDCRSWASGLYHIVIQLENTSTTVLFMKN